MVVVNFPNGFGHLKFKCGNLLLDLELKRGMYLRKLSLSLQIWSVIWESTEEILAEQVVCFYMTCSILVRN